MKNYLMLVLICLGLAQGVQAEHESKVRQGVDGVLQIRGDDNQWQSVDAFWLQYADTRGGLTWGRSAQYPPYAQVKEFDTFMVEVAQGPCLMEFFHGRWRRANDVRRWHDAINDYAGCPHVFD